MEIVEAIKKANADQGIRRKEWGNVYIIPTDSSNCCELYINDQFRSSRWNPKREDLIANDWMLCDAYKATDHILPKNYDPAQLVH